VTPNPEIVMRARTDPDLLRAIEGADLAPADGVGLRWAGRLLGEPIREVVPGSELVERMATAGAASGQRWFLLGAAEGVAGRAAEVLRRQHPGLVVAGTHAGSPRPADDDEALEAIAACSPISVLLVAYGAPWQELWLERNLRRAGAAVGMGVGGTLDFIAGVSPTPPDAVKRWNAIWLYRLVREPWRWRRQLALPRFAALVVVEAARRRWAALRSSARSAP
jgi:N-acetylglucosaminyldiphosphoundecaprenol N-acetyl-beta-D-mannosaminyltransferase